MGCKKLKITDCFSFVEQPKTAIGDLHFTSENLYRAFKTGPVQSNWIALKEDLYLSPSRVYSAELGRFIQRDPLPKVMVRENLGIFENSIFYREILSSKNLDYSYLNAFKNNPINEKEIFGLNSQNMVPLTAGAGFGKHLLGTVGYGSTATVSAAVNQKNAPTCPPFKTILKSCDTKIRHQYKYVKNLFKLTKNMRCSDPIISCNPCKTTNSRTKGQYLYKGHAIVLYTGNCKTYKEILNAGCHEIVHAFDACFGNVKYFSCDTKEDLEMMFSTEVRATYLTGGSRSEACQYAFEQTDKCAILLAGSIGHQEAYLTWRELKRKCKYDKTFWTWLFV